MLPQPSPPSLSAFINSCCGVRLHSATPGVTAVPEVPAGLLSSSPSRALFMAMFPMFETQANWVEVPNWATLNFLFSSTVIMFQEVWSRSFCRTIEKLVEVVQEYPTEVEHIYSPSCVPLVRCAGCCGDENLECHPTHTTNVTMELLKIRPSEPGQEYVEMTFVEHQTCECRKRQRGRGRKKKERQKMKECDK
uniref:Placental growth factor b n=1 Tax=Scophthalmus maximus TaxID=52904 RepID=A0A8D3BUS0_SCOMX